MLVEGLVTCSGEGVTRPKKKRSEFIERMRSIITQEVISIDESGFHKQMSNKYAYSTIGSKVYHQTTSQHHQNYSLMLAISSSLVIIRLSFLFNLKNHPFNIF